MKVARRWLAANADNCSGDGGCLSRRLVGGSGLRLMKCTALNRDDVALAVVVCELQRRVCLYSVAPLKPVD